MKIKLRYLLIILINFTFITSSLSAIESFQNKSSNKILSIGIVPFKLDPSIFFMRFVDVIDDDLTMSGLFSPLNQRDLPQIFFNANEIQLDSWTRLGVDAVLIGQVILDENDVYAINYQLIDTKLNPGKILSENQYLSSVKEFRYSAHKISDEIFEYFFDKKWGFSDQLIYIKPLNIGHNTIYELRISDFDSLNDRLLYRSNSELIFSKDFDLKKKSFLLDSSYKVDSLDHSYVKAEEIKRKAEEAKKKAADEAKSRAAEAQQNKQATESVLDDILGSSTGTTSGTGKVQSAQKGNANANKYVGLVKNAIQNKLLNPNNIYKGKTCLVNLNIDQNGILLNAKAISGDEGLCSAVLLAAKTASIPKPLNKEEYETVKDMRINFSL